MIRVARYVLFGALSTAAYICGDLVTPAHAQTGTGEITGLIRDQAGAAVPGATITATETRTNFQRVVVSTGEGLYTVPSLAPGEYRLDLELTGFKSVRRSGIRLATGEKTRIDFDLEVGTLQEQVTVVADSSIVRTETASLGTVVENEQVVQLPLNGRLFITLTTIVPGVALPPNSLLPRINGGRPRTNEYLFDGISVLQPEPGQVAYYPVIDSIQEFKIESNSPAAEFGRFNGGVVNLTTKSGTNAFRGSVFGFFRNEHLNARNYFQQANPTKPEYRRNQYGGVLGGPLVRDRTFFFVDYQGQRQEIGRTVTSTVPTVLQRQGTFTEAIAGRVPVIYDPSTTVGSTRSPFPGNTIPRSAMDSVALALLERYPAPTAAGTANNYSGTANEINDQDQGTVRLDHRLVPGRDQVFGRLAHFVDTAVPVTALPDGSGAIPAGSVAIGPQKTSAWSFASNYQHTFSGNLLNEFRIGDTRRAVDRTATQLPGPAGQTLNIPGIPPNVNFPNTLPTFAPSGYQQLGSPQSTASNFKTSVTQIADSLTWLKGRHALKMGFDWRWERLNVVQPPFPTGNFTFRYSRQRLARRHGHRQRARKFLARSGAELLDCVSGVGNPGTRADSGVLHSGRLEGLRPPDRQSRPALHAQLPFDRDQRSDRRAQSPDPATRLSRRRAGAASQEEQFRSSHWGRLSRHRQDDRQFGIRNGVDRNGRHHHSVHDADVPVPPGSHAANARQHCSSLCSGEGTDGDAGRSDAERGPRAGRVHGRRRPRIRPRTAMERVGAARADVEHGRRGVVSRIEDHQRRHPGQQHQSTDRRAAAHGPGTAPARAESVLRDHSTLVLDRRSRPSRLRNR